VKGVRLRVTGDPSKAQGAKPQSRRRKNLTSFRVFGLCAFCVEMFSGNASPGEILSQYLLKVPRAVPSRAPVLAQASSWPNRFRER